MLVQRIVTRLRVTGDRFLSVFSEQGLIAGLPICLLLSTAVLSVGCGSSSDSSVFGAAYVRVSADPNDIDVGDTTLVTVRVENIKENGILLKIRVPEVLGYVPRSGSIEVKGEDVARDPDVIDVDPDTRRRYLVFFLSPDELEDDLNTTVALELEGLSRLSAGEIEVDPDVNSPDVPDDTEFSVDDPQFDAEDETEITVRGAVNF